MSDIIQEVPVKSIEAPVEQTEAPAESTEAPMTVPVKTTLMPKAKGRPEGVKYATIRKRRPAPVKAPPPSEASSSEDLPPVDMRSRKQRTYDSWFD